MARPAQMNRNTGGNSSFLERFRGRSQKLWAGADQELSRHLANAEAQNTGFKERNLALYII